MLTLRNSVKYIGLVAVTFFLIKSFTRDKISDSQIFIVSIIIMLIVLFIISHDFNCSQKSEKFLQSLNLSHPVGSGNFNQNGNFNEMEDLKKAINFDHNLYDNIIKNENKAKEKIKSGYKYDMKYTKTNPLNTVPLGSKLYEYTLMPPENWFRAYEAPPVCITDKKADVKPFSHCSINSLMQFDDD